MRKHGQAARSTFHFAKETSMKSLRQRMTEDMQVRNHALQTFEARYRQLLGCICQDVHEINRRKVALTRVPQDEYAPVRAGSRVGGNLDGNVRLHFRCP